MSEFKILSNIKIFLTKLHYFYQKFDPYTKSKYDQTYWPYYKGKIKMFQSPENTIIKSKYFRLNKEQPYPSNFQVQVDHSKEQSECFTPIFRGKDKTEETEPLRKTDKIQNFSKIYEHYFKNSSTTLKPQMKNNCKNPQDYPNLSNTTFKNQTNQQFSTPQKFTQFLNIKQHGFMPSDNKSVSCEFLFINSPSQFNNTPSDSEALSSLPNEAQTLNYHLQNAKKQAQKLRDQNHKLRLQKVKIAAKTSQNETMKLIPLKIQYQKLKRNIEKLMQQKQMLEINKKLRNEYQSQDLKVNGTQFKVIKNIAGTKYSQQYIDNQKKNLQSQSRVIKKPSDIPHIHNSPPPSNYSNNSSYSTSSLSIVNKNSFSFQETNRVQSPKNIPTHNQSVNKCIPANDQCLNNFFNPTLPKNQPLTGANFIKAEMQKMKRNEVNTQQKTSKNTFITFAKASLKNGNTRPTFYKSESSQIVQNLNSSSSLPLNKGFGVKQQMCVRSVVNNVESIGSVGYGGNQSMYGGGPVTSISQSPRAQYN